MTAGFFYLMEHDQESVRLERKTDISLVHSQARWAGIAPGMHVADIGCGSGKVSNALHQLVQPGGQVLGIDGSEQRISYAAEHYRAPGLDFVCRDVYGSLEDLGPFDFIWVRFFLEYHRSRAVELVTKFARLLKPGGILCLIDLDYNCLNHYELPRRLEKVLHHVIHTAELKSDFDTRMGIKLYSFLYDLGFDDIDVTLQAHHLIYGALQDSDDFNWTQKMKVAVQHAGCTFDDYENGFEGFKIEFKSFFSDPRRFTYTPVLACRGRKPEKIK